jgi:SAM-dependent methyltransferase
MHDIVVCSACSAAKLVQSNLDSDSAPDSTELRCPRCRTRFPVVDGVIDMLPGEEHESSLAQRLMEWDPMVRIYESRLWRRNPLVGLRMGIGFEDEFALIANAGGYAGAKHVLDLACGPGIYTRRFARIAPEAWVVGLDLSVPMLSHAARRARKEAVDNMLLVHGNAEALPFEAAQFDCVNCCGALHLFPDLPRVLAEVGRVLRPGGHLTAAVFRREEVGRRARVAASWNRYIGLQPFTPRSLEDFFSTAGLSEFELLHPGRAWMVASAKREDGPNTARVH